MAISKQSLERQTETLRKKLEIADTEMIIRGKDIEGLMSTIKSHADMLPNSFVNIVNAILNPYIKRNTERYRPLNEDMEV